MMRAERPRRAVIEAMARDGFRERYPEGARPSAPPRNISPTLRMLRVGDVIRIPYRGRVYELGHVSFEDGMRLVGARAAVEAEATPENADDQLGAMRLVVSMAPRYLLPVARVRRFFWRLHIRRNPFRKATVWEVGQLLGFFLASQMRSRVPSQRTPAAEPELLPTS